MSDEIKKGQSTKKSGEKKVAQVDESGDLKKWLNDLYNVDTYSDVEIKSIYESCKYIGFDRDDVLKQFSQMLPDTKLAMQAIIICAIRGPLKASKMKLSNGRTIESYGISGSGGKGSLKVTCSRITSATADLAAYFLKRLDYPKRINVDCPSWLQFPAAGSIKLPHNLRAQHIEFSRVFSKQIKGEFNESIYQQMELNAYLDTKLNLFEV